MTTALTQHRIFDIRVDEAVGRYNSNARRERTSAINDLLASNHFELVGREGVGPYGLALSISAGRLVFHISDNDGKAIVTHVMSLRPLHRIIKDYWMICDAHIRASSKANAFQLEAIDMGRRAFHNEGSQLLIERLSSKVKLDLTTARGLFTLISALLYGTVDIH